MGTVETPGELKKATGRLTDHNRFHMQGALVMTKAFMKKPRPDRHAPQTADAHDFRRFFARFAHAAAHASGTPTAFLLATASIVLWAAMGPLFGYSDTWQLVINTATTIITFLMVFLIQNTQNRDSIALQVKLDELIIAMKGAKNSIAGVEELSEDELERLHKDLLARAQAASDALNVRRRSKR